MLGSEGGAVAAPRFAQRRRRIVKSYAILLEHNPTMAGKVAKDLTNWRSQALLDPLSSIMKSETMLDPDSKMAVSYYLSMAPRFRSIEPKTLLRIFRPSGEKLNVRYCYFIATNGSIVV